MKVLLLTTSCFLKFPKRFERNEKIHKNFVGKFVKDPEKLDEFEEEFDDKLDFIDSEIRATSIVNTVCIIITIILAIIFLIRGELF